MRDLTPPPNRLARTITLLASLLLAQPFAASASEASPRFDFEARSATVEALLAAQKRLARVQGATISNDPATKLFEEARTLQREGNQTLAYSRLEEAYQLARIAVRALAEEPPITSAQLTEGETAPTTLQRRLESLSSSVKALLEAYGRIAGETGTSVDEGAQARVRYEHALDLISQGREAEALPVLKHAYAQLQQTINKLRGGRVLVRELKFDTPADEYWYEVDRLNTHMMLVKLLLDEPSQAADRRVQSAIDSAMKLNWSAQMDATAGDYPKAIHQLEQATQGLFRVIMSKGFDIPG